MIKAAIEQVGEGMEWAEKLNDVPANEVSQVVLLERDVWMQYQETRRLNRRIDDLERCNKRLAQEKRDLQQQNNNYKAMFESAF